MGWTHDLEPALFDIKGDDSKVRQAIEKIIENAVEATNEQGRVHLETSNQQFHSNYHDFGQLIPAGYYIRVDITDNGVGIPDEDLPNLIKPFFTTKNKDQHQGLGLAWAFGIVTNKGGYLAIDNSRQSATQVRIYLPAKPRSQNQDDDVTTAACNPGGSKRLLVVDDEEIILTLAETVLGSEGHDVVTTTNGMDALQLLEASHTSSNPSFDLLISDLVMPGMSGKVLIERVRRIDPNFRILCTTGFVGSSIEGVVNLPKPFTSRDLIKRVNQVLGV